MIRALRDPAAWAVLALALLLGMLLSGALLALYLTAPAAPVEAVAVRTSALDSAAPLSVNSSQIDSGRYVMIGVILYDKQQGQEVYIYNGSGFATIPPSDPPPTETPGATDTPEQPTPTLTPSAAPTIIPSITDTPELTPTPDDAPQPTPVGDGEKMCLVKLRNVNINERTEPRTTAPRTATSPVPSGSTIKILEVRAGEGYLWGRSALGWFVIREGSIWWVDGLEGATELCPDVEGWPQGLVPPAPIARAMPGVWVGPGAHRDELLIFGVRVKAAGLQPAATVYGEPDTATILYAQGWHVALRAAGAPDCPDMALGAAESAQRFVTAVLGDVGTRSHATILANECTWPSAVYARDWVRAAADEAAARGVRTLVPIVWNPGAPDLDWVPIVAAAYRDAPIALLWGMNLYPVRPETPLSARGETQWTTWRYELYMWQLEGVPLVATEYARGDGSEPPDFADIAAFWQVAGRRLLWGTAWYAAIPLGHWPAAALTGRLSDLVSALL